MGLITTNQFKNGVKVLLDGDPCVILENQFVKPGKGQAFNRVKLRNLKNGRILEKTFKSGDTLDEADAVDLDLQYLYREGELWYFMSPETFEQYVVNELVIAESKKWLKEQDICKVTLWNNQVIVVSPPIFVMLTVTDTDPGIKGDTATGGSKPATLETGAIVRVPLFIGVGEVLKIDTRTGEYVARTRE